MGDGYGSGTPTDPRNGGALGSTGVPGGEAERLQGQSNPTTWRDGLRALRDLPVEHFNGKGRDVEIVRTEPRDVAPVIALPVRMHGNRVIQPLGVPAGTLLGGRPGSEPVSFQPGPLARALMAEQAAGLR